MIFKKVTLEGKHVRLEPLVPEHKEGLCDAILDGQLWNLFVTLVPNIKQVDDFLADAYRANEVDEGLAFAVIDKASQRVAGSTRLMKADIPNKKVEIGFTFLAKSFQKTHVNTEAKLLLLTHAFEVLRFNRVELLTDYLNAPSKRAILRLGAKQEGIMRNHMLMPDGRIRDSVLFSIIQNEWRGVKQNLYYKLSQK